MEISVIGSGHVGLVMGACLARLRDKITLVDIDESKMRRVNNGILLFYEKRIK